MSPQPFLPWPPGPPSASSRHSIRASHSPSTGNPLPLSKENRTQTLRTACKPRSTPLQCFHFATLSPRWFLTVPASSTRGPCTGRFLVWNPIPNLERGLISFTPLLRCNFLNNGSPTPTWGYGLLPSRLYCPLQCCVPCVHSSYHFLTY